jgi:2-C-methyl-D-erythritol 4-phosphate cytidylyltransferase
MPAKAHLGAVIVAAGSGTRFGATNKVFAPLGDKPLLHYALELFTSRRDVAKLVVVLGPHTLATGQALVNRLGLEQVTLCLGGATRTESVRRGVCALGADCGLIAVHDAARPLASQDLVTRVVAAARVAGAAVPAVPVGDTVHVAGPEGVVLTTPERTMLRAAQTPQVARRDWLLEALERAAAMTDEAGLLAAAGFPVTIVDGEPANIKITRPEDLALAEVLLRMRTEQCR